MTDVPARGTSPQWWILAASMAFALLPVREAHAVPACTPANIFAQDAGCPNSAAACQITKIFEVGSLRGPGCDTLDFGARAVTITASGEFDFGSGNLTIKAGSLTLAPGSQVNGRGVGTVAGTDRGGMLTIQTTGVVDIQRSGVSRGIMDLSGNVAGGTVLMVAGGAVNLAGRLQLNALTINGSGGSAVIRAGGNISGPTLSTLEAFGRDFGAGGAFDFTANGSAIFADAINVEGGVVGGSLDISGTTTVSVQRIDASATAETGAGGRLGFVSGTTMQFTGFVTANGHTSGGCGGTVDAQSLGGDLFVAQDMRVEGASPDGAGGDIDLEAEGTITIAAAAVISTKSNGEQGCAGELGIDADLDIFMNGVLDASANAANSIDLSAGRNISVTGPVRADGAGTGATGGDISFSAGNVGKGNLTVINQVNVTGGPCGVLNGCGEGGTTDLAGCDVFLSTAASVLAGGPRGGRNSITARENLNIQGPVDARKTIPEGTDGGTTILRRTDRTPVITGAITPAATTTTVPACTNPAQAGCLIPCPTCGNGVIEFPETCDTAGTPVSCDGCSVVCRIENCNDGLVCTSDTCAPTVGCANVPIPGCTTTTTTTTTSTTTTTTLPTCRLDVDTNGTLDVATDVVYIARHLLGLAAAVPPSFRVGHPEIPSDAVIAARVDALGTALDVDTNGVVDVATDVVYIARHELGLAAAVPPSFRVGHPEIPSDATIAGRVDALCP